MAENNIDSSWAEAYQIIHGPGGSNLPEIGDVEYYLNKAEEADGPILEIGCGTGRVYIPIASEGYDVRGIDLSQPCLDILREEAHDRNIDPSVQKADMRSMSIDTEFELIIIPYNAFRYNRTVEDQLQALEQVKEHLSDSGLAIISFSRPEPEWSSRPQTMRSEFSHDGDEYLQISTFELLDEIEQIVEIDKKLYRNGTLLGEDVMTLTRIYKREFTHLLERAGFSSWDVYDDYEENPLGEGDKTKTIVWNIQK